MKVLVPEWTALTKTKTTPFSHSPPPYLVLLVSLFSSFPWFHLSFKSHFIFLPHDVLRKIKADPWASTVSLAYAVNPKTSGGGVGGM